MESKTTTSKEGEINLYHGSDRQQNYLDLENGDRNVDTMTGLLSNESITLIGHVPYPGVYQEKCFKMVCFIDVSSFQSINLKYGYAEGDIAIKKYAHNIDKFMKEVKNSLWTRTQNQRLIHGTTHRKDGDKFVIIITGVSTTDDNHEEVPNEIYKALANGFDAIKYEKDNVNTFLRTGFCWCMMNDMKDMNSMIRLAELVQEEVKIDLDKNDCKSLQQIREEGKSNVSPLIQYNEKNLKRYEEGFTARKQQQAIQSQEEALILKSYLALGLADGYFWNFVREVAIDIRDANGQPIELSYPKEDAVHKVVKRLLIVVPNELDWDKEDPIADFRFKKVNEGHLKDCQIPKSPNRSKGSRIKWVSEVVMPDLEDERIVMDIPTILTSIIMSLKDKSTSADASIDVKEYQAEVKAFCHQIIQRLKKHKLDKYVSIVEIDRFDTLSNFMDKIKEASDQLNVEYKNTITYKN